MIIQIVVCMLVAAISFVEAQDDGFTDENRPYEFGFNIEGYQHRHEKKDEKGIIMGEFGFITADGVYHLTVYATDENGDFKILKMKNIKIGLPMDKIMMKVPGVAGVKPQPVKEKAPVVETTTKFTGLVGCSGCLIPTTASPEKTGANKPSPISGVPNSNAFEKDPDFDIRFGVDEGPAKPGINRPTNVGFNKGTSSTPTPIENKYQPVTKPPVSGSIPNIKEMFTTKRPTFTQNAGTPVNNMIEGDKLPGNMKVEDLMAILYKFNYTLNFHGHHETGDRAGNKQGGYFFNGRDGFARDVKYIANEFGYQPNITLVDLGLDSEDTPKEETEKMLTKLKGYEFKWFYLR